MFPRYWHCNSLNYKFLENTLILDQSSIHHVCCIYLSCNLVFFQMLYKTIQITKWSFNNALTQTSWYNIVNFFFTEMLPDWISTVNKSLHLGTDFIKINRSSQYKYICFGYQRCRKWQRNMAFRSKQSTSPTKNPHRAYLHRLPRMLCSGTVGF